MGVRGLGILLFAGLLALVPVADAGAPSSVPALAQQPVAGGQMGAAVLPSGPAGPPPAPQALAGGQGGEDCAVPASSSPAAAPTATPEASIAAGAVAAPALGACQAVAAAVDSALDAEVRKLASELRCPVCPGLSVEESQTELSREFKVLIREQLAAGRTPEEVKAYFVSKYGEWILLEPEPRGFNLLVYLLPVVALLVGAGVVAAKVRRWTQAPAESGEAPSAAEWTGADPARAKAPVPSHGGSAVEKER